MSKLLCNVLKISGGANATNAPPWLCACYIPSSGVAKRGRGERSAPGGTMGYAVGYNKPVQTVLK